MEISRDFILLMRLMLPTTSRVNIDALIAAIPDEIVFPKLGHHDAEEWVFNTANVIWQKFHAPAYRFIEQDEQNRVVLTVAGCDLLFRLMGEEAAGEEPPCPKPVTHVVGQSV